MISSTGRLVLAVAVLAAAHPAAARDIELKPRAPWSLDYDTDRCVLTRILGTEQDPAYVRFIRMGPGTDLKVELIGAPFATTDFWPVVRLRFGETGQFQRMDGLLGSHAKIPAVFTRGRLDNLVPPPQSGRPEWQQDEVPVPPETEAAVSTLYVKLAGRQIVVRLGPLGKPMASMRACTDDLVRSWGLDPAVRSELAHGPWPVNSPSGWIVSDDYPAGPWRSGQQAIINFRLMVDAQGRTTSCSIQSQVAASAEFAKTTCALLQRKARFVPAITHAGVAQPWFYTNSVRWIMR